MVVNKVGLQEQAEVGNKSIQAEMDRTLNYKKEAERTTARNLAESNTADNVLKGLLSDLAKKVLSVGVNITESLNNKVERQSKDEYDLMFDGNRESTDDSVKLSNKYKVTKKQQLKNNNQNSPKSEAQKKAGSLKEYSAAYSQYLVNGGKNKQKSIALKKLQNQMIKLGYSVKDIQSVNKNILASIRSEIAAQIKEKYLGRLLSQEKSIDWAANHKGLNDVLDFAFVNHKTGGWNFGGKTLQGAFDEVAADARSEVKDFVQEEIQSKMVKMRLFKNVSDKELKNLLKLGSKVGFDSDQFLNDWNIKMIDLGLVPIDTKTGEMNPSSSDQGRKDHREFEFDIDDQKEGLINQIRAIYMQRAIGGLKAKVRTFLKMRKSKNGLIRLGVKLGDIDFDRIEKEGVIVARQKLVEVLQEAFDERATMYDLRGTAYNLIKKKIKSTKSNLLRLGVRLNKSEINQMIEKANGRIFGVARLELAETEAMLKATHNPNYEKKQAMLVQLLKRIQEESPKISPDFDPEKNLNKCLAAA